ncbi:MAG: peptidase M28 [Gammaproteobacteria bacterium]|nr:MAG: peptidase M28 [Gammaproteobacteria bacterium]TND04814.1 MAG: peptidase M28 [Gammaproteobacteria bacterium]
MSTKPIHHDIVVTLSPTDHAISVVDTVRFGTARSKFVFSLHRDLKLTLQSPGADLRQVGSEACGGPGSRGSAACYEIVFKAPADKVSLRYQGVIFHPLVQQQDDVRVSELTEGTIVDAGVFLDSGSRWYPVADAELVTFALEASMPAGWDVVSQGKRLVHVKDEARTRVVWAAPQPQDDIYLIAGRYHEYSSAARDIPVQVFLRSADDALAQQYLDAGVEYLAMYDNLLGPYPHEKFAVVENFWETGYGMPSFTVLGPKVMRFPFILHSSYPHEILHNWWGNGVYVDYEKGNWSEGLTAYLADHLIREKNGDATEYRRAALQNYQDYVAANNEFPLVQFTGRHSSASEAIGYGKTMMLFHMLRQRTGDEVFLESLRRFYSVNRFRRATFDDLRRAFEETSGWRYGSFFDQWILRTGAPVLRVNDLAVSKAGGGYRLDFELAQTQATAHYNLQVPVAVTLEGIAEAYQTRLSMDDKTLKVRFAFAERPLRVEIDPEFDLFRHLAADERPATLSQIFGADRVLIVLPEKASAEMRRGYQKAVETWPAANGSSPEVRWDNELTALPKAVAVVVVGQENRFRDVVLPSADASVDGHGNLNIGEKRYAGADLSVALVANGADRDHWPLLWLVADSPAALPGLMRKLPHYGKYSYVMFNGAEPTNIDRGVWTVTASSMSVVVPYKDGGAGTASGRKLKPRHPLTDAKITQ